MIKEQFKKTLSVSGAKDVSGDGVAATVLSRNFQPSTTCHSSVNDNTINKKEMVLRIIPDCTTATLILFLFPATYLASILLLQTLAVFLTVIYLDLFHKPDTEPVPDWLQAFARHVLSPLACLYCKSGSQTRISPETPDLTDLDPEEDRNLDYKAKGIRTVSSMRSEDSISLPARETNKQGYSWKYIVFLLDKVTMYVYLMLIMLGSICLVAVLLGNYLTA